MRESEHCSEVINSIKSIRSLREERIIKVIVQYFEITYNSIRDRIIKQYKWIHSIFITSLVLNRWEPIFPDAPPLHHQTFIIISIIKWEIKPPPPQSYLSNLNGKSSSAISTPLSGKISLNLPCVFNHISFILKIKMNYLMNTRSSSFADKIHF